MSLDTQKEAPTHRECRRCKKSIFVGYMHHVGGGEFEHKQELFDQCIGFEADGVEPGELKQRYTFKKHGKGGYW